MPRNLENPQWVMWPDEHIKLLKSKWLDHSAGEIAKMLSDAFGVLYTRSAVIGKANRLKLARKPSYRKPAKPKPASKPRIRKAKAKRVTLPALPINRPEIVAEVPIRGAAWLPLPGAPAPKPMAALGDIGRPDRPGECRWPIGENPTLFCGCPSTSVYCPTHTVMGRPQEVAA